MLELKPFVYKGRDTNRSMSKQHRDDFGGKDFIEFI
jgi:hypothetical protein